MFFYDMLLNDSEFPDRDKQLNIFNLYFLYSAVMIKSYINFFKKKVTDKMRRVITGFLTILLLLTPLLFTVLGAVMIYDDLTFSSHSIEADGIIVGYKANQDTRRMSEPAKTTYAPIVEFQTKDGTAIETVSRVSSSSKFKSDRVKIRYDVKNPKDIRVEGDSKILISLAFLLLGSAGSVLIYKGKLFGGISLKQIISQKITSRRERNSI